MCNCLSYFTTAKISFASILYPQFIHIIFIIYGFTSFSSYNGYKLNSHLTCFRRGFIAQSAEHRTGIAEVMGSNPVGTSEFFLGFICSCLSCFTTAKISFTSIIYLQFTHMIFIIYTSRKKHSYDLVNGLNPGISVVCLVWSSGWGG